MKTQTSSPEPFDLSVSAPAATPVPGCDRCAELARERGEARRARDYSRASDCAVGIRTHDTGHLGTPL
jgi:hypothetical protein